MPDYEQPEDMTWTGPDEGEIRDIFAQLRFQFAARNGDYLKSRHAYDGKLWEELGLPNPASTGNRYGLTASYIGPFADKEVQIMMGQIPAIQVLPSSAEESGRDHAERCETLLYGNWAHNDAHFQLLCAAWNSIVLRRGILHYWWDANAGHARWESVTPDNFYPVMDGQDMVEAIYVSRRLTRALKRSYPHLADDIVSDPGFDTTATDPDLPSQVSGGITDALQGVLYGEESRDNPMLGYTTVIDYYDNQGAWVRIMGNAVHRQNLGYPVAEVPFIDIPNSVRGEVGEPKNSIDHLVELNQYYNVLLSQAADIIRKYSNPPIIDKGSGVDPARMHSILAGDGGILPIRPNGEIETFKWEGNEPDIPAQMVEVKDLMYDLSGKPRSSFGQTVTNQSGVVTNLALTPTLQSNELRQTIWSASLVKLNKRILMLYEKFKKAELITFHVQATKYAGAAQVFLPLEVAMTGQEIGGWYENQIKWPSAIRVDDPVYIDTVVKLVVSEPPLLSVYDAQEMLGWQDVEARIDRIRAQREDPRIHPEIMQQAVDSMATLAGLSGPDAAGMQAGAAPTSDPMSTGETAMASGVAPAA